MENYLRTLTTLSVRALSIKKSLGTRAAAGFLRNRGVSLNVALRILARRGGLTILYLLKIHQNHCL